MFHDFWFSKNLKVSLFHGVLKYGFGSLGI